MAMIFLMMISPLSSVLRYWVSGGSGCSRRGCLQCRNVDLGHFEHGLRRAFGSITIFAVEKSRATAAANATVKLLSPVMRTTKRFPVSRCASAVQIVRPLESTAETQPQLQPPLLGLSAI
jgi:hypothetical protein